MSDPFVERYKAWQKRVEEAVYGKRSSNPEEPLTEYQRRIMRLMTELEAL